MTISKYQFCNDCRKKFTLPTLLLNKIKKDNIKIYCPYCHSGNTCSIGKNQNI